MLIIRIDNKRHRDTEKAVSLLNKNLNDFDGSSQKKEKERWKNRFLKDANSNLPTFLCSNGNSWFFKFSTGISQPLHPIALLINFWGVFHLNSSIEIRPDTSRRLWSLWQQRSTASRWGHHPHSLQSRVWRPHWRECGRLRNRTSTWGPSWANSAPWLASTSPRL